jgi:hypothetical protein
VGEDVNVQLRARSERTIGEDAAKN